MRTTRVLEKFGWILETNPDTTITGTKDGVSVTAKNVTELRELIKKKNRREPEEIAEIVS